MTNPADFRVATCNAKKELTGTDPREVINQAAAVADVIVWQEIETAAHKIAIRNLRDFDTYWPAKGSHSSNAVPISYRKGRFMVIHCNRLRILLGIRRVTPDRWTTHVVLRDQVSRQVFAVQNAHLISQAFTSHRERRGKWDRSFARLSKRSAKILKNRGALVFGGDMNAEKKKPTGMRGVWTDHGTFGSAHYDTLAYAGAITLVSGPKRVPTKSDHDILVATFRRTA